MIVYSFLSKQYKHGIQEFDIGDIHQVEKKMSTQFNAKTFFINNSIDTSIFYKSKDIESIY